MKRLLYILLAAFVSFPVLANANIDSLFYQALLEEDFEMMTLYAQQGASVDITPNNNLGVTILHNYAMYGNVPGVKWCIDNKANLNVKDLNGFTPLHYAVMTQQTTICKMLVEHGADVNCAASNGMTAASIADLMGNPELVKYLNAPKKNKVPTDFNAIRLQVMLGEKKNDFEKAVKDLQKAIKEAEKTLLPSNKFYSLLWVDLANDYDIIGEREKAEAAINEGLNRAKKYAYGSETYYRILAERALFWLHDNNIDEAIDSLLVCNNHIDEFSDFETKYAVMKGLGNAALSMHMFDKAIDIFYQALSYAETLMFLNKQAYEDYYYTIVLAICNLTEGQGTADDLNRAILMISQLDEAFRNRHDYLSALYAVRKGHLYFTQGDYYRADEWYRRAEKDWYNSRGIRHIAYANIIYFLAEINSLLYDYEYSIPLYKLSLGCLIECNAKNTILYPLGLNGMAKAMLLSNINGGQHYPYTVIDNYLYDALARINDIKGRENHEFIMTLSTLCQSLYVQNNDTLADYYTLPFHLTQKIVSPEHPFYQARLLDSHLFATGLNKTEHDAAIAYSSIIEYDSIAKKFILDHFLILSEEQRSQFWSRRDYSSAFESVIPTYIHTNVQRIPSLSAMAYDDALFRKGILLNTSKVLTSAINNSNDTLLQKFYKRLIQDKIRYQAMSSATSTEQNRSLMFQLQDSINDLEQYITSKCRAFVDYKDLGRLSWKEIKDALKESQAAIEIIRFDYYSKDSIGPSYYVATIVTPDSSLPHYVYLCEESELSSLLNRSNKDNIYSNERSGRQLTQLIWDKLTPYIGNAKTIYFSPDGLLCQLAVEALPLSKDSVYSDAYDIVRCSSTKYILQQHKENRPTHVDLFGGIQYNMTADEMTNQNSEFALRSAYRGEMPDSLTRSYYKELPGTKEEVNGIARILQNGEIYRRLFTGKDASEEAFKALSGTHPNVLHIATHGFYWPKDEAARKDYFVTSTLLTGQNNSSRYISSMERSGLLLAGANIAMTGHRDELPDNVEDGVLSSQEIASIDLYGTDLVVLSACETGQGDLQGDGVYGLQRAFKQAGAQTIIMSLWKVNDATTQLLMTEFYRNWITNHQSKREAFRNAQNTVRSQYEEPVYWAGFIMLD